MDKRETAVSARGLSYKYEGADRYAVDHIDLDIPAGEFISLLGRNGSGKSTLGKLFNGLFMPSEGTVSLFGHEISSEDDSYEARKRCGMVFQDPDNQMVATIVEEDVAFGCENLGMDPKLIRERVRQALETVGMTQYAKTAPHMLSGGQKQRIAIAGVLAMRPDIIVFDESTSMLDPSGREEIFALAKELNQEGVTIVWITHFMDEAARSDRVIVIDEGKIALQGTPKDIFSKAEQIKSLGLDVPDMTYLAQLLRLRGLNVSDDILTIDEMEVELCRFM